MSSKNIFYKVEEKVCLSKTKSHHPMAWMDSATPLRFAQNDCGRVDILRKTPTDAVILREAKRSRRIHSVKLHDDKR